MLLLGSARAASRLHGKKIGNLKRAFRPHTSKLVSHLLQRLQQVTCLGQEVKLEWHLGTLKHHNGKKLAEQVVGDIIVIYTENPQEAIRLVRHGFAEWILNQHTKPHRQLINKLVNLFEEQQYWKKKRIVEALTNLLDKSTVVDSQVCNCSMHKETK